MRSTSASPAGSPAIRPRTLSAARAVRVTTVSCEVSIVAIAGKCIGKARCEDNGDFKSEFFDRLRDTCNALGCAMFRSIRASPGFLLASDAEGGRNVVQRLAAIRDLRAFRPRNSNDHDGR